MDILIKVYRILNTVIQYTGSTILILANTTLHYKNKSLQPYTIVRVHMAQLKDNLIYMCKVLA